MIVVTGATGQLGEPTVAALAAKGAEVRGVSRHGEVSADLLSGNGVGAAFTGADTVVHAATMNSRKDLRLAANLVSAAQKAGVGHVVLVSIVGIDRIPLGFYKDRLAIEQLVASSGVPFTIQRATQFHSFVERFFTAQRFSPVLLTPALRVQPIAVEDVGARLADLAIGTPQGRVADIGGPETRAVREFLPAWQRAANDRRRAVSISVPGKIMAAFRAGANLVPGALFGTRDFDDYLAEKYGR
jgi:uncharacterized protein YbjT (DUF2867 family)